MSVGKLSRGCDKSQLLLIDSKIKQVAVDTCQPRRCEELQSVAACRQLGVNIT